MRAVPIARFVLSIAALSAGPAAAIPLDPATLSRALADERVAGERDDRSTCAHLLETCVE